MITDAYVYVVCDNTRCTKDTTIELEWKYTDYSGDNGYYDSNESDIEDKAEIEGWIIKDGKHFCCKECIEED